MSNIQNTNEEEVNLVDDKELFSDTSNSFRKSRSPSANESLLRKESLPPKKEEEKEFVMKNGCCRKCMKAFSDNGKSCLCQVPKNERKYTLSDKGCNYCGCHGCSPVDVRKNHRRELKAKLREDKSILYKRQRLIDSDDEDVKIFQNDVDEWNQKRKELLNLLLDELKANPFFIGFGVPLRTPSYVLGYQPNSSEGEKKFLWNKKRERTKDN